MGCDLDRFGDAGLPRDLVEGAFDEPVNEAGQPAGLVWFDALHACHVAFSFRRLSLDFQVLLASAAWQHELAIREGASYSSWRRHQMPAASLRPLGARSSHGYIPQRASQPRA